MRQRRETSGRVLAMYVQDGVTCLRGAFDQHWIDVPRHGVDRNLADLIGAGCGALLRARALRLFAGKQTTRPKPKELDDFLSPS